MACGPQHVWGGQTEERRLAETNVRLWHKADMLQCADECPLLWAKQTFQNHSTDVSLRAKSQMKPMMIFESGAVERN